MRVSIVTTCLNSAATIEETIQSILSQLPASELEYIVTDAGSTDGTKDILARYSDRITLLDARRLNQSAGINLGLRQARGEILAFLNADDVYQPNALKKVCAAFDANPDTQWLAGQCSIIDRDGKPLHSWITSYKNFWLRHYSYFSLLCENFISQPAVFFRRSVLDRFGFFSEEEQLVMDYEYWLRIGRELPPLIVPEYLAAFRRMPSTKSNSFFMRQFKDDLRVGWHYARQTGNVLAMPIKALQFVKTVGAYSLLYR